MSTSEYTDNLLKPLTENQINLPKSPKTARKASRNTLHSTSNAGIPYSHKRVSNQTNDKLITRIVRPHPSEKSSSIIDRAKSAGHRKNANTTMINQSSSTIKSVNSIDDNTSSISSASAPSAVVAHNAPDAGHGGTAATEPKVKPNISEETASATCTKSDRQTPSKDGDNVHDPDEDGSEQHFIDAEIQRRQLADVASIQSFYSNARQYWDHVEPTIDGMLGGFADINPIDIRSSRAYLEAVFRLHPTPRRSYALDCGAGIGRITKSLLLPLYDQVDAVEQCERFADEMPGYVRNPRLANVYNCGLQQFVPDAGRYDLIWSQWVLGHLTDDDLVAFFKRCAIGLAHAGIMVVKENVTSSGGTEIDETDSSLTRSLSELRRLLVLGGWRILRCTMQQNLPTGMYPVYMITARPLPRRLR